MPDEPVLAALASEVDHTKEALIEIARTEPTYWWTASELAAKPEAGDRQGSVVMIALNGLIKDHIFEVDKRWRVRIAE